MHRDNTTPHWQGLDTCTDDWERERQEQGGSLLANVNSVWTLESNDEEGEGREHEDDDDDDDQEKGLSKDY